MIEGGKSLVSSVPSFSNDGKKLLVCSGTSVTIFSTATALQITSLEGHTALVTFVVVAPAVSKHICFCWTSSLDGTIRYWDFSVPELMKTVDIHMPIFSMIIPSLLGQPTASKEEPPGLIAYVSVEKIKISDDNPRRLRGQIRKCNLSEARLVGEVTLAETEKPESISASYSGKYFGIQCKRKLHIWNVIDRDRGCGAVKRIILHHTKNFAALAFHPTNRMVAAGDVTGRILIWREFAKRTFSSRDQTENGKRLNNEEVDDRPGVRGDDDAESCTTWHWHAAEVIFLSFSSDGAYLYSGGTEGVLVIWQLETGKKKFLPRIGSPLLYFRNSLDHSLSYISCADNQIHILKMPSMEILKSISGIQLPFSCSELHKQFNNGFAFDPVAGLVAICTENYCIQFYSLFDDRGVSDVQVCERNHQPGDDITVMITLVALSPDGTKMSTVETRLPEENIGGLISLQFWTFQSQNRVFALSTIIYEPHGDSRVSSLAFHPHRPLAASTSDGGDFKVWICNEEENAGWACHAVGSYKRKPMSSCSFSADGSVLAVAVETVITLWEPCKNVLVAVIGETLEPIKHVSFVGNTEYLVSASRGAKAQLSVWSMSSLSAHWSYKLLVEAVTCATDSPLFAILALLPKTELAAANFVGRDGIILLLDPENPVPLATWSVRKASGGGIAFLDKKKTSPSDANEMDKKLRNKLLVFIDGHHEYVLFDPSGKDTNRVYARNENPFAIEEKTGQYGYASVYGELPAFEKREERFDAPSAPEQRPWESIFSGPSHAFPPLTKLCAAFLESLLEKRTEVLLE